MLATCLINIPCIDLAQLGLSAFAVEPGKERGSGRIAVNEVIGPARWEGHDAHARLSCDEERNLDMKGDERGMNERLFNITVQAWRCDMCEVGQLYMYHLDIAYPRLLNFLDRYTTVPNHRFTSSTTNLPARCYKLELEQFLPSHPSKRRRGS